MHRIFKNNYESDSEVSGDEDNNPTDKLYFCKLRKELRDKSDPFAINEDDFKKMFRLSRCAARGVIEEILEKNPNINTMRISSSIAFHLRFLAVLNFFGNGSYQKPTANNFLFCQGQSTMSKSLHIVLVELLKLKSNYIKFPRTTAEVAKAKMDFMTKFHMPGVICAVDGTHVAIIQPPERENGCLYYNRKHFYSVNALAACTADQQFVYVDAQYPGSVHDSAIWNMCRLKEFVVDDGSTFVLGDAGFPSANILLTPVLNTVEGSKEER